MLPTVQWHPWGLRSFQTKRQMPWHPTLSLESPGLLFGRVAQAKVECGLSLRGVSHLAPEGNNCSERDSVPHEAHVEAVASQCDRFWRWAFRRPLRLSGGHGGGPKPIGLVAL